jgi:hypothetical protein
LKERNGGDLSPFRSFFLHVVLIFQSHILEYVKKFLIVQHSKHKYRAGRTEPRKSGTTETGRYLKEGNKTKMINRQL